MSNEVTHSRGVCELSKLVVFALKFRLLFYLTCTVHGSSSFLSRERQRERVRELYLLLTKAKEWEKVVLRTNSTDSFGTFR
jgi:hypothetical protein